MVGPHLKFLLALLVAVACAALAGPLALASAAEGEGTTTVETPPLPVETPVETPTVPTVPTPVETPVTTPPSEAPSGTTTTPATSEPSRGGSTSTGAEPSSGSGGGAGSTSSGSSGPTGTTTTSTGTTTTHRASHAPQPSSSGASAGKKAASGGSGSTGTSAGGGSKPTSASHPGGTGSSHPAPSNPTVSPAAIDEGASAVSHVASHVGEVLTEALPTAPLKEIGARIAAHAGLAGGNGGVSKTQAVDGIGKALGAALIGSAVAVEKPPANHLPIPILDATVEGPGTIFLVLVAALLLVVAAGFARRAYLTFRRNELLDLDEPATEIGGAAARRRGARALETVAGLMALAAEVGERSRDSFRRVGANAVAGLRSLF